MRKPDINKLMVELLESGTDGETGTFNDRGKAIIDEISDYAEQTDIFKSNKERGEVFDGSNSKQIWAYMLDRICNAPTSLHRNMSIILIMPFLRAQLRAESEG